MAEIHDELVGYSAVGKWVIVEKIGETSTLAFGIYDCSG